MVVLEFNELNSDLIHRFMGLACCRVFVSFTNGQPYSQLMLGNLRNPGAVDPVALGSLRHAVRAPPGLPSGRRPQGSREVCRGDFVGCRHTGWRVREHEHELSQLNGYFMPDPWHKLGKACPGYLQPYYDIIARQVQESSRDDALSRTEMAALGWFMLRNGLTLRTGRAIARQLVSERHDPGLKWRRASLLRSHPVRSFSTSQQASQRQIRYFLLQQYGALSALLLAQHGARALRDRPASR